VPQQTPSNHPAAGAAAEQKCSSFMQGSYDQISKVMHAVVLQAVFSLVQGFKRFDPVRPYIKCPPHQPLIRYGNAAGASNDTKGAD
jgi:hypothetical protein